MFRDCYRVGNILELQPSQNPLSPFALLFKFPVFRTRRDSLSCGASDRSASLGRCVPQIRVEKHAHRKIGWGVMRNFVERCTKLPVLDHPTPSEIDHEIVHKCKPPSIASLTKNLQGRSHHTVCTLNPKPTGITLTRFSCDSHHG